MCKAVFDRPEVSVRLKDVKSNHLLLLNIRFVFLCSFNRLNHVSSVFWNPDMNKALNSEVTAFVMSCSVMKLKQKTKAKKKKKKKATDVSWGQVWTVWCMSGNRTVLVGKLKLNGQESRNKERGEI